MALSTPLSSESIDLHTKLLVTIHDGIQTEHWQKMKVRLNLYLGSGTMEEKNFLGASEILYERGFIKVGEYSFLVNLLDYAGIPHLNNEIAEAVEQIKKVQTRRGQQSNTATVGGQRDRSVRNVCENTEKEEQGAASGEATFEHAPIAVIYNSKQYPAPTLSPRLQLRNLRYIPQELREVLERFRFISFMMLTVTKLEITVLKQQCTEPYEKIEELIKLTVECCGNIDREDCVVKFTEAIPTVEPYHGIPCEGAAIHMKCPASDHQCSFGAYAKAGSATDVYILTTGHGFKFGDILEVYRKKDEPSACQAICRYNIFTHDTPMVLDIAALEVPSLIFKDERVQKVPKPVSMNLAGTPVYKTGAGSGYTTGMIIGTDIFIHLQRSCTFETYMSEGCTVRSLVDGENFARPGDSGSVVYSMGDNIPLCMIVGDMISHDPLVGCLTFCIHLDKGLQALGAASGSEWTICSADDVVEKIENIDFKQD